MIQRPATRDHRIDFLRGWVLLEIFVNHIPGNTFEQFSHKNFGITDAAEVFVLLAGVAAAFAYFPPFANGDRLLTSARVIRRAGTLYVAHLSNLLAGLGLFAAAAIWLGTVGLLDDFNLRPCSRPRARQWSASRSSPTSRATSTSCRSTWC
ncbi:OpgC protein [Methylobrevis pamukkalensis]|uniref:OpgC protein n=1 Tax=Methylobrevis pamukkalensis TaxID=1439726 RepID=A0A1E3H159_9HYPH|nr:OpgC domain-containing protein [Methylobrevis pamukkalensis]ODN70032.1 OpgC protein [Methylobrevis pamukkalensis]